MNFNINDALDRMFNDDENVQNFFGDVHQNLLNGFVDQSFMAKLYAVKKKENHVANPIKKYVKNDTISLPVFESERLLAQDVSTVEIFSPDGKRSVYAKVTKYDSDPRTVQLPMWMFESLDIQENAMVKIVTKSIKSITKISISCPKEITNSLLVVEFEIRDRNILYKGDVFLIKMFEKEYKFTIDKLYNGTEEIVVGTLYDNSLTSEIIFDINVY